VLESIDKPEEIVEESSVPQIADCIQDVLVSEEEANDDKIN
jgi:hypothetical protein